MPTQAFLWCAPCLADFKFGAGGPELGVPHLHAAWIAKGPVLRYADSSNGGASHGLQKNRAANCTAAQRKGHDTAAAGASADAESKDNFQMGDRGFT